jgi:hypothetical protein
MNKFEICVQQYSFTKRCWWQLSSLAEQTLKTNFTLRLSIHNNDPFRELNNKLISTFSNLIDLKVKIWTNDTFFRRGDVRNTDLVESSRQWIIFADADVIFDKSFFEKLNNITLIQNKMSVIRRFNTSIDDGYKLINSETYNTYIKRPITKIMKFPLQRSSSIGAGYFQLINADFVRNKGLKYSKDTIDRPLIERRGPTYRSDRQLRGILGLNRIDIAPIYHINHYRLKNKERIATGCQ